MRVLRVALILAAMAQDPSVEAHIGRGYQLVQQELYEQAAEEFQAALTHDPKLVRVRYQLAICLFAQGKHDESRAEFERLRAETGGDPNVIYHLGRLDLFASDYRSAIARFQQIVRKPPYPDTAFYLGMAYMSANQLGSAIKWLEKAAELTPRDFRIYYRLGRAYQAVDRPQDAHRAYARFSELRQGYADGAAQASQCGQALRSKAMAEARTACRELADPNDPDKLTLLGIIYGQNGVYEEAIDPLSRAARLDPDSFEIFHNLGVTYFRLRRFQEARGALEKAVRLRPDFFGSSALLGATLFTLKEDEPAYRALDHAHRLNPDDADTSELLFRVCLALAQSTGAVRFVEQAAELRPDQPAVHKKLAEMYSRMGRHADADRENREAERLARSGRR